MPADTDGRPCFELVPAFLLTESAGFRCEAGAGAYDVPANLQVPKPFDSEGRLASLFQQGLMEAVFLPKF